MAQESNNTKQDNFTGTQFGRKAIARGEKSSPLSMNGIDDFDQMLLHEDFGYYLFLASQLKHMHQYLKRRQVLATDDIMIIEDIINNMENFDSENQQINITKKIIRDKLCNNKGASKLVLKKGLFPQTDSLMSESIKVLKQQIKKCYDEIKQENTDGDDKRYSKKMKTEKGAVTAQPIAIKYSKYQTDVLTNWMIQHRVSLEQNAIFMFWFLHLLL